MVVFMVIAMICMAVVPPVNTDYTAKWLILPQCVVTVNGSTNLNKFACTVAGNTMNDTLTCVIKKINHGAVAMNGNMMLPVAGFDCVNTMMTKDLRKTLREKEYPGFYIYFVSMERYPLLTSAQEFVTGTAIIELAGVKKLLEVHFRVSMDSREIIQLAGTQSIYFSAFNLVAPRKLGGIIKTNDRLDVEFIISCRLIK